jgi:hypothetical protein
VKTAIIVGILLFVLGVVSLVFQGIKYSTKMNIVNLSPIQAALETQNRIPSPPVSGGFKWANFQVMRRTHASLMRELEIDPKIVADQFGPVDVNLNVYRKSSLGLRREAVESLESALQLM